jgi:plasmid maintenance system antidote protein VapI
MSALLRQTIAQAIESGRTNYLTLERETGVARASIRRFVNGERTLRLDVADQLAAYFGLELSFKGKGK